MRNPGGVIILDSHMGRQEADTFTCGHCNAVVIVPVKASPTDMGGLCGVCDTLICPKCVDAGRCSPLEENLRRIEARDAARKSYGL